MFLHMEYNPYNAKNKVFTQEDVHTILSNHKCRHCVNDISVFQTAMVHSSYVKRTEYTTPSGEKATLCTKPSGCLELFDSSYERLEHLGDSVLGVTVSTYLSRRFPTQQEGFLTTLRKEIVCNVMLGSLTQKIGLDTFYIISRHNEDACAGRTNTKKLGDILEAFIGALWIDSECSFVTVYSFIVCLIERYIDIPKILLNDTNYKDQLQKVCQATYKWTPTYKMISSENGFIMCVIGGGKTLGTGTAPTKKQAEQLAASEALKKLRSK
jgi:ribonuclease-3